MAKRRHGVLYIAKFITDNRLRELLLAFSRRQRGLRRRE
jgi:hypothetical protein